MAQPPGFPGEDDEDGLRNFLGLMWIARVAQRDGIDLIDVPRDERGKSFLRAVLDVFLQQNAVVQFPHLQMNAADARKVTASVKEKQQGNAIFTHPMGEGLRVRAIALPWVEMALNSASSGVAWTMSMVGLRCRAAEILAAQQRTAFPHVML